MGKGYSGSKWVEERQSPAKCNREQKRLPALKGSEYKHLGKFAKEHFQNEGHNTNKASDILMQLSKGLASTGSALVSGMTKDKTGSKIKTPIADAMEKPLYEGDTDPLFGAIDKTINKYFKE